MIKRLLKKIIFNLMMILLWAGTRNTRSGNHDISGYILIIESVLNILLFKKQDLVLDVWSISFCLKEGCYNCNHYRT